MEDKKIMAQHLAMLWEINKFNDPSNYASKLLWPSMKQIAVKHFDMR